MPKLSNCRPYRVPGCLVMAASIQMARRARAFDLCSRRSKTAIKRGLRRKTMSEPHLATIGPK